MVRNLVRAAGIPLVVAGALGALAEGVYLARTPCGHGPYGPGHTRVEYPNGVVQCTLGPPGVRGSVVTTVWPDGVSTAWTTP